MTLHITIIGLGQIGASIGLALAAHKETVFRVGVDCDLSTAQKAKKMGALDRVEMNLPQAVGQADLVILSLPADQLKETLGMIAVNLKEGAVVTDTAPIKQAVISWTQEVLPNGRHYLGLIPVLNPLYLHNHDQGMDAAHADLFRDGMLAIVSPPGTPSNAFKRVNEFANLLGAQAFFVDPVEADSLMASIHLLPQLVAAALLNITVDQPGWRDARMLAGRPFAQITDSLTGAGEAPALAQAALLNSQSLIRLLDNLMASLGQIREDIHSQNSIALHQRLEHACAGRQRWWKERQIGNWEIQNLAQPPALPSAKEILNGLLGRKKSK